jgi:nucleotide-binding universal stress UspA family protein
MSRDDGSRPMLIGYDGSSEAACAIDVAATVLEPRDAVVLGVAPRLTLGESIVTVGSVVSGAAAFEGVNEADARRRAEVGARLARRAGLHAKARASLAGRTWEGIVEAADDVDAAVVVLGAGRNVTHDAVGHARRPILIVPRQAARAGDGPIVIGYDGSQQARSAIGAARALLRVRAAVVLDAAPLRVSVGYSATPSAAPWVDAADPALAYARAETGVDLARATGFDAVARTHAAPTTSRALLEVAEEVDAGVIVVGARGVKGPRSVSREVADHARRPVLVVPPAYPR